MANEKLDDIMKTMLSGMTKLDLEDLANVTGGAMTPEGEEKIRWGVRMAKDSNMSMEELLQYVPQYYNLLGSLFPGVTVDDAVAYIQEIWDSV